MWLQPFGNDRHACALQPTYSCSWEGLVRNHQNMENRKFVVAILGLLSLVVVKAGGTCDIDGQWYDPTSTRNYQVSPASIIS